MALAGGYALNEYSMANDAERRRKEMLLSKKYSDEVLLKNLESHKDALAVKADGVKKKENEGRRTPIAVAPVEQMQRLTMSDLEKQKVPPRDCMMLSRDFIHDSLYNANYGYFSKKAHIFSPPKDIPFNDIRDNYAFMNYLADLYKDVESAEIPDVDESARQVWHTPTELFRPWYGYSIANYIMKEFKRDPKGAQELIIYEVGGGNGTLMTNILDFIQREDLELYARTKYVIIEISSALADRQSSQGSDKAPALKHKNYQVINKSIFDWKQKDNFSHDLVRYDFETGVARQGLALIDKDGDYQEAYEPLSDPLIERYLKIRESLGAKNPVLPSESRRKLRMAFPFAPNLSKPEFLPTMCLLFVDTLKEYFPNHRLVLSDFDQLPDTIPGHMAPVVQTRYKGAMVACSTYLVQPGWFDIFFPTNFELLRDVHAHVCHPGDDSKRGKVITQKDFLLQHANLEATKTRSGEIPMLGFYSNFKFLLS
ncbi:hypothetical protein HDV05_006423 [Chytridiales sp. JEL 0842]|nr:hypothetical protein HDV05_006423 [Chytridiales sp. JEL 0842]